MAISRRLERAQHGNFGDYKAVGEGVNELRIDLGPGYRVYLGQDGEFIVIILCGGDKDPKKGHRDGENVLARLQTEKE